MSLAVGDLWETINRVEEGVETIFVHLLERQKG